MTYSFKAVVPNINKCDYLLNDAYNRIDNLPRLRWENYFDDGDVE